MTAVPLPAAVEALYAAFADVPRPLVPPNCSRGCCMSDAHSAALIAPVPVRELPADAVVSYALDAMTTITDVDVLRYLLPRVVELSLHGEVHNREIDHQFSMLRAARWWTWPEREVAATRQLMMSWWAATLDDPHARDDRLDGEPTRPDGAAPGTLPTWRLSTVLNAIVRAETDLRPYLDVLVAAIGSQPATGHLRALMEVHFGDQLRDPAMLAAVTAAFEVADSEETMDDLVVIDGILRWERSP